MNLYVTNNCPACKILYPRVQSLNITIKNIDNDPEAAREYLRLGLRAVPTLVDGHVRVVGARDILVWLDDRRPI